MLLDIITNTRLNFLLISLSHIALIGFYLSASFIILKYVYHLNGYKRLGLGISLVLLSNVLGSLWSILIIPYFDQLSLVTLCTRLVQLSLEMLSALYLTYVAIEIRNERE